VASDLHWYWSSTAYEDFPSVAYGAALYYGQVSNFDYKSDSEQVWPVRGGLR